MTLHTPFVVTMEHVRRVFGWYWFIIYKFIDNFSKCF